MYQVCDSQINAKKFINANFETNDCIFYLTDLFPDIKDGREAKIVDNGNDGLVIIYNKEQRIKIEENEECRKLAEKRKILENREENGEQKRRLTQKYGKNKRDCPTGVNHNIAWKTYAEYQACPSGVSSFEVSWKCPNNPPHSDSPPTSPMTFWAGLESSDHKASLQSQTFWGYVDCDGNGGEFWAIGSAYVPDSGLIIISTSYATNPGNNISSQIYMEIDDDGQVAWFIETRDDTQEVASILKLDYGTTPTLVNYTEAYVVMEAYNGESIHECESFYPENQTNVTFNNFSILQSNALYRNGSSFIGTTTNNAVCNEHAVIGSSNEIELVFHVY